jgi:hypothetical protein
VASLGDVPNLIWDMMPFCSCHRTILYRNFWRLKFQYRVYFGLFLKQFSIRIKWLAWPVPGLRHKRFFRLKTLRISDRADLYWSASISLSNPLKIESRYFKLAEQT